MLNCWVHVSDPHVVGTVWHTWGRSGVILSLFTVASRARLGAGGPPVRALCTCVVGRVTPNRAENKYRVHMSDPRVVGTVWHAWGWVGNTLLLCTVDARALLGAGGPPVRVLSPSSCTNL